jgi:molybdate transport system substrate-binding protein
MLTQFRKLTKLFAAAGVLTSAVATSAHSEDITFLCASALRPAMDQLVTEFQRTSSHRINVAYANLGTITKRLLAGESIDLSVTSPEQWDTLQKQGRIAPDFKVVFAKVGIGVAIKKGTARPDLSSPEAVKRMLLNARAVAFADPTQGAPSGKDAVHLFARLDISAQMQPKSKLFPGTTQVIQAVAEGNADLGIMHTSVIAGSPRVELADPLPAALQNFTVYVASIPTSAKQAGPAKSFVKFLTSPSAIMVFKSKGLDPG